MRTLIALVISSLVGCGASEASPPAPPTVPAETPAAAAAPEPVAAEPALPPPRVLAPTEARAVGVSVNALGAPLFARVAAQPGNVALSPASVESALAMVAMGARGETQRQLLEALRTDEAALDAIGQTTRGWNDAERSGATLRVANRLFAEDRCALQPGFLEQTRTSFGAPLERVDFARASEAARLRINGWVADQTRGHIADLLAQGTLDADTRLVVVNAVYLDAAWAVPFDPAQTRPASFRTAGGERVEVPTMHREGLMGHLQADGATIVELPYAGDDLVMRFVLPGERTRLEDWVTGARLADPVYLEPRELDLALPRFEIRGATVTLTSHLQALGVVDAFDRERADLTGIAAPDDPRERLFVRDVYHQAFVRVDEAGAEAAAASAVVTADLGGMHVPRPPLVVRFDRPFLFVVLDRATRAALFVGRVDDPR